MPKSHKLVYTAYILIWMIAAIHPVYPQDWLLENVLVFVAFPLIVWLDKRYRLSLISIVFLLIFGSLHALGAHYTYGHMHYFDTITEFFGFERNHYDRLVHLFFGLLYFRAIFEVTIAYVSRVSVALIFAFSLVITISTVYEILEWLAIIVFHPDLGMAFLGAQGDMWDAQKDMLAAIIGALVNIVFFYDTYAQIKRKTQEKTV